ncbi:TonB-dependent receptor [Aliiglaciecola lipolytica]|nr:TonB-dependent receptor [Aliiglaciecola lipolytica]
MVRNNKQLPFHYSSLGMLVAAALFAQHSYAQENTQEAEIEEISVIGKSVSYANNQTSETMLLQQSSLTSVLSVIDNLPGVLINEGDTFGTDDWSTTVSIRGFQLSLDQQQIGITVDGIANGNSNYGGGAKANRYIDTENLATVEVSQGTSDIASRSNEALGGTLNFVTIEPGTEEQMIFSTTLGDFDAQKMFVRYETGEIAKDTYAWFSVSSSSNTDWVNQSAENTRDHIAAKIISSYGDTDLTAYFSWDDAHEDNYQRVSLDQFVQNPDWDRLTSEWTGIPYIDQLYRKGWSTLRENRFAYVELEHDFGSVVVNANAYYHYNEGRGDWIPQYLVDVEADGTDQPHSELVSGNIVEGGSALSTIYFVDATGVALSPIDGCVSSITFPYGGAGAEYDPACYASGALPVSSYRHTHYEKERIGFNADFSWIAQINDMQNNLRGGIWYEDYDRNESRDWHKIIDSRVGYEFDNTPYWVQYDRSFPVETTMLFLEDTLEADMFTARFGVKQFYVDLERTDNFGETENVSISSDSDLLLSAGLVVQTGLDGLEVFAGYAENFAAIKDTVLEADSSQLADISPETAENLDLGVRYNGDIVTASLTYYSIKFEDRLTFIAPDSPDGIDFLIGTNGGYVNVGGIDSSGLEASINIQVNDNLSVYGSFTKNDAEYTDGSIDYPVGNTVFGSAEHMAVISIDWNRNNYIAGLSTKWVDDRFIDAANTQVADAYLVSDFYAGVIIDDLGESVDSIELRLTVNNMFDESYLGGISGQSAWIGAPRTAAFNAMVKF